MLQINFQVFGDNPLFDAIESGDNFGDSDISFNDIQEEILLEVQKILQERVVKREDIEYSLPMCFPTSERRLLIFIIERVNSDFIEDYIVASKLSKIISEHIGSLIRMDVSCCVAIELSAHNFDEFKEVVN